MDNHRKMGNMDEECLSILKSKVVYLPGGCDHDGRILLVISLTGNDLQTWNRKRLEISFDFIRNSLSAEDLERKFILIIDTQKCSSKISRVQAKNIVNILEGHVAQAFLVRQEGFWDKHMDNCSTKSHNKTEPIIISKSRLQKYFDNSNLPEELGGNLRYDHDLWIQNHVYFEEFRNKYEKLMNDSENFHIRLLENRATTKPLEMTDQGLKSCSQKYAEMNLIIGNLIQLGNQLATNVNDSYQLHLWKNTGESSGSNRWSLNHERTNDNNDINTGNKIQSDLKNSHNNINFNCINFRIPQDIVHLKSRIGKILNEIEKRQTEILNAWNNLEVAIRDTKELTSLGEGVAFVTNWILNTGEFMLNYQCKVGSDVQTCETLRREHEILELHCSDTYGYYAELLYKINSYPFEKESFSYKDLISQKDFMDFVCRSFAARLERRRNVLITSVRFYRLVSEYFDKTNEVFESLIMGGKPDDHEWAKMNLQKLKDCQQNLEIIEKEILKEGEKLSDMLSMPIKDSLGRDLNVDYSHDIANIRDVLDATISRRNIFIDNVELQKLTLEQITHIHAYENDAKVAIKWMDDLYMVMIRQHSHVGCSVHEIQAQKNELQTFQETGKSIYDYGYQLLEASYTLRQSCKLNTEAIKTLTSQLQSIWNKFRIINEEHMTRLRVSAVFHRSVEEYCNKLYDLKSAVLQSIDNAGKIDENSIERNRSQLKKYLSIRERLLVEVGRMVRLGRLLKTRLREPFVLDVTSSSSARFLQERNVSSSSSSSPPSSSSSSLPSTTYYSALPSTTSLLSANDGGQTSSLGQPGEAAGVTTESSLNVKKSEEATVRMPDLPEVSSSAVTEEKGEAPTTTETYDDASDKNVATRGISSDASNLIFPTSNNSIACEAISDKLAQVSEVAEALDMAFREVQDHLDLIDESTNSTGNGNLTDDEAKPIQTGDYTHSESLDEWNLSVKSTEDESFITAVGADSSDLNITTQSQASSSYQTISEYRDSPPIFEEKEKSKINADNEDDQEDNEAKVKLKNETEPSGGNVSFDGSSEQSFRSAQAGSSLRSSIMISNDSHHQLPLNDSDNKIYERYLAINLSNLSENLSESGYNSSDFFRRDNHVAGTIADGTEEESNANDDYHGAESVDHSNKNYPTSHSSTKPEVRFCEIRQTSAWSEKYYQQNIAVAKHAIKGCAI